MNFLFVIEFLYRKDDDDLELRMAMKFSKGKSSSSYATTTTTPTSPSSSSIPVSTATSAPFITISSSIPPPPSAPAPTFEILELEREREAQVLQKLQAVGLTPTKPNQKKKGKRGLTPKRKDVSTGLSPQSSTLPSPLVPHISSEATFLTSPSTLTAPMSSKAILEDEEVEEDDEEDVIEEPAYIFVRVSARMSCLSVTLNSGGCEMCVMQWENADCDIIVNSDESKFYTGKLGNMQIIDLQVDINFIASVL